MRYSRLYDAEGGWSQNAEDPVEGPGVDLGTGEPAPAPAPEPTPGGGGGSDPEFIPRTRTPQTGGTEPGPNSEPAPQNGNPSPAAPPTPPAVASAVPGIQGSDTTGGVRGSFAQAGTGGFSRRFGAPAAWFKGGPTAGMAREAGNIGRGILGKDRAGSVGGGASVEPVLAGPSVGGVGGGKNDEEWQRIIQQVLRNKFGG